MLLTSLSFLLFAAASTDSGVPPIAGDSAQTHRIVRHFEPVEVRAPALDLRSNAVVHPIPEWVLRSPSVTGVRDVLALQPGVVEQAGELHVRGGRAGETLVSLDGMPLNEPIRGAAMELPVLAIAGAELMSGAPEARFGGALAGQLDLHTADPGARPSLEWQWRTDGGLDTRYDQLGTRLSSPLPIGGLGVVAATDATLDNTSYPALRTQGRHELAGLSFGWRAENRLLGWLKIAPVRAPGRLSLQVLADHHRQMPYDPAWILDGYTWLPDNPKDAPRFSDAPDSGYYRYRAADHLAITDDRRLGALFTLATPPGPQRARIRLGWLGTRSVTSVSGNREPRGQVHRVYYRFHTNADVFHVVWGDYPTYRESASNVFSLGSEGEIARGNGSIAGGAGLTYEEVQLRELDWLPLGRPIEENTTQTPLDTLHAYHAWAPGGYAFSQARWQHGGMLLNAGVRAEYWTPGPQARGQTLPWNGRGSLTLSPRLGLVFPVSPREALSFAYVRLHQPPERDLLYDRRIAVNNRLPLGNPGLVPSTVISYEAALKHLIDPTWSLQTSVFYRDVFDQPGARDYTLPLGPYDLRYENADEGHAEGFELTLVRAGASAQFAASYTWLQTWGNESRSDGDPYGAVYDVRTAPVADRPLHWDREHSIVVNGEWSWHRRWHLAWASAVGSPLPWTPKPLREPFTDLSAINSRRLGWTESTHLALSWSPPHTRALEFGIEAQNLFNEHGEERVTVDGYPNPIINTHYDDYSAYRTETGLGGGAYWSSGGVGGTPHWVPVNDPRLYQTPRTIRATVGAKW